MIGRLEAGEALAAIERAAISHNLGFEREADRKEAIARLERRASGTPEPAPLKADPADLAAMGIAVQPAEGAEIENLEAWLGSEARDG